MIIANCSLCFRDNYFSSGRVVNWDRSLVSSGYAVHSGTAPRLQEVGILGGRLNIYTRNRTDLARPTCLRVEGCTMKRQVQRNFAIHLANNLAKYIAIAILEYLIT